MSPFDHKKGLSREWRFADDDNHFSSGTASGPNTRREHGLLSWKGDGATWVLVNTLEEWVSFSGRNFPLSSNIYFDHNTSGHVTIYPEGYRSITNFSESPFPAWTHEIEGHTIRREVLPARGGGILVQYFIDSTNGGAISLSVRPMISCRKATDLHFENRAMRVDGRYAAQELTMKPYPTGAPGVSISHSSNAKFAASPLWYRRVRLITSQRDEESLLSPGELTFAFSPDKPSWLRLQAVPEK